VVFPGLQATLNVQPHTHEELIKALQRGTQDHVGIIQQSTDSDSINNGAYRVGTYAKIAGTSQTTTKVDGEEVTMICLSIHGLARMEVQEVTDRTGAIRLATVTIYDDPMSADEDPEVQKTVDEIKRHVQQMVKEEQAEETTRLRPLTYLKDFFGRVRGKFGWPPRGGMLADQVAAALPRQLSLEERQQVLETFDVRARTKVALELVKRAGTQLRHELSVNAQERRNQAGRGRGVEGRKQTLPDGSKEARRDGSDPNASNEEEVTNLSRMLQEAQMTPEALKLAQKELQRLQHIQPHHPEYTVCRTYLETLAALPWAKATEDVLDLRAARQVLEEDHYGLEHVKSRILEFVAVRKLRQDMKGPILCLHGPPGVGKTSLGRSIARALGRKFHRVALGGARDEAELRGHRRTYIGSMPGTIIQAMISLQVRNPVILLDEIDKVSHNAMFNPSGVLLEILDPEQNNTFRDHYLNTAFNLSQVLFLCTCNDYTIDRPLLDRMEIIELSGYTVEEKVRIVETHLLPKQRREHALEAEKTPPATIADSKEKPTEQDSPSPDKAPASEAPQAKAVTAPAVPRLELTKDATIDLIEKWTSESGVRSLERRVAQVCRWAALRIVDAEGVCIGTSARQQVRWKDAAAAAEADALADCGPDANGVIRVDAKHLPDIVGAEVYVPDIASTLTVGVAMGLSVTATGGQLHFVEATKSPGSGRLVVTGLLGDVMRESVTLSLSLFRNLCSATSFPEMIPDFKQGEDPFRNDDVHVHFPAGATPKDGPSAGVACTLALASLMLDRPMRKDTAVTGEVTLRGLILPVGGIRDKVLAAHRAGLRHVLLPAGNERHAKSELPASLRGGIELHFLSHIREALDFAFEQAPRASNLVTAVTTQPVSVSAQGISKL